VIFSLGLDEVDKDADDDGIGAAAGAGDFLEGG
jgi:hypothetical protein